MLLLRRGLLFRRTIPAADSSASSRAVSAALEGAVGPLPLHRPYLLLVAAKIMASATSGHLMTAFSGGIIANDIRYS